MSTPPPVLLHAPLVCDKLKPTQTISPRTQQGRVVGDSSYGASGLIKVFASRGKEAGFEGGMGPYVDPRTTLH